MSTSRNRAGLTRLTTVLSPGAQRLVEGLEELGLIKVTRRERDVIIELNPEGWRHP